MKRLPIRPKDFMASIDDKILDLILNEFKTSTGQYLNESINRLTSIVEPDIATLVNKLPGLDDTDKQDVMPLVLLRLIEVKDDYKDNPKFWIYHTVKLVVTRLISEKRRKRNAKVLYFDVREDGAIGDEFSRHYYCSPTFINDSVVEVREDKRVNERQDISFDKRNKKNGGQGR